MTEAIKAVTIPEGAIGIHAIKRFDIPKESIEGLRLMMQGRGVRPGTYTKLLRGRTLVMSDTHAERSDHYHAVRYARGSVRSAVLESVWSCRP